MNFNYLTLPVDKSHIALAARWYTEIIGLSKVWQSDDFVLLEGNGGPRLGLHRGEPLSEPEKIQIHFEVQDVDHLYRELRSQGVAFLQEPKNTSWGYRVAILQDPLGHTIELFTDLNKSGEIG